MESLQKLLSEYPRETPFTHRTITKIMENFPSFQGSKNSDLGGSHLIVKVACLSNYLNPLEATLKAANLETACLQIQVNLWILQVLPCSEVQHLSCSTTWLGASSHLYPDFHARFSCQSLNVNNEDLWHELWGLDIHSKHCQIQFTEAT